MTRKTEGIWIAMVEGGLARRRIPEVGDSYPISEQPIYAESGELVGFAALDEPVRGRVTRIGAHWSDQPAGMSGYWVFVSPIEES
jgi:hypothetical protein